MPRGVYALAAAIFAITTSEFMVAGLLPDLARSLDASVGQVGYLVSIYAGAMAIGGPLLALALVRRPPRAVLLGLLALFAVAQAVAAVAPSYAVMAAARATTGLAASATFGVAVAITVRLVDESRRGRGLSVMISGLMLGTVLGLPAATVLGHAAGWRVAFWAVAGLTVLAAAVVVRAVPALAPAAGGGVRDELAVLANRRLWAAFGTSLLIIAATFAAFSYLAPILERVAGFDSALVPLLLALYGLATVAGNVVVGRLADRFAIPVTAAGLVALATALAAFALLAGNPVLVPLVLVAFGLVGVSLNPAMAARVMGVAGGGSFVSTVHTALITTGVLLGSALGGWAIDAGLGLRAPLWIGAALAVAGLASLWPVRAALVRPRPARACSSSC